MSDRRSVRFEEQLRAAVSGEPWHGPGLMPLLADISATDAARHPIPGAHSVWELVLHLTAWTREVTRRLDGVMPGEPADGDFPPVSELNAAAWRASCAALVQSNEALIARLAQVPDTQWREHVVRREASLTNEITTYAGLLSGLLQHHAYHGGQIALLKRALTAT